MRKILLIFLSTFLVASLFVSCEKTTVPTATESLTELQIEKQTESNTVGSTVSVGESDSPLEGSANSEIDSLYGTYFRKNNDSRPIADVFTITLNADGTYNYYETMISSHLGFGRYTVDGNIITIRDDDIPTLNGSKTYTFKFEYRDGKLIFLASESDNFMYVNLPDGAEFERAPQE